MTIQQFSKCICEKLYINEDIEIEYTDENNPSFNLQTMKVKIIKGELWNQVYQLSHELLHASFYLHNGKCSMKDYIWIEEIMCEAFSIYCLENYSRLEFNKWNGYLYDKFYIINGNTDKTKNIKSIAELNRETAGYKDCATRQFIHPIALRIKNIITLDFDQLIDFLDYKKYVKNGKLYLKSNNKILRLLYKIQEQLK